ncbi:MAG: substrate-binding domain-containing protein, partial [Ancalomicrobiaceae bacterium]|nr:substrate-binding domain-containing protein [Ancalomicrobiaceae bacterium]
LAVEALADHLPAATRAEVTLLSPDIRMPDLVIAGSHCVGLEPLVDSLAEQGIAVRVLPIGSTGGLNAARRGECDIAPIHLIDPASGSYNAPFLDDTLMLLTGWRRLQGLVFRPQDRRFEGLTVAEAIEAVAGDPTVLMVNRNAGSGTRILIDGLLRGRKPEGWSNQPKSHNAVAAAVAQGRADWGMAIATVAKTYGLGFLPYADEHYDFAVVKARADRPAVAAFRAALASTVMATRLAAMGFARD